MTPMDPMGFLERFPPLQNLMTDASIASAVQSCNSKVLYKSLRRWCRHEKTSPFRPSIQELLKQRRFFVYCGDSPGLFTFNGIGTRLYGQSEMGTDGTYIATLFLVFIYLPIIPISQYVVRDAGLGYEVFGSVPRSFVVRAWQWMVLAGIAGMIGLAISHDINSSRVADMQILNGLDSPVVVSVGGAELTVKPQSHIQHRVKVGPTHILARLGKRTVEELDVQVPAKGDFVAYNVLGAAPLYAEGVIYSEAKPSVENGVSILAGESFIVRPNVPYVFQKPPESIQVSGPYKSETRWCLQVAPEGWRTAVVMLLKGKREHAEELAVKVAIADPENQRSRIFVHQLLKPRGAAALIEYGRKLVQSNPDSVNAHRTFQDYLRAGGKTEEALKIYAKMRDRKPENAMAQYLFARLLPNRESIKVLAELASRFREDPYITRSYALSIYNSRKYAEALPIFEKLAKLDRDQYSPALREHVVTLVALGRPDEGARIVAGMADYQMPEAAFSHAVLYGRVAKLARGKAPYPPDYFLRRLAQDAPSLRAWFAVCTGERLSDAQLAGIEDEDARSAIRITAAIGTDPATAVMLEQKAADNVLRGLEDTTNVILLGELLRLGKANEARRVLGSFDPLFLSGAAIQTYLLSGKAAPDLEDTDLECQAAMHFGRARLLESQGKPSQGLYKMAADEDLLKGAVTRALSSWPRPTSAAQNRQNR